MKLSSNFLFLTCHFYSMILVTANNLIKLLKYGQKRSDLKSRPLFSWGDRLRANALPSRPLGSCETACGAQRQQQVSLTKWSLNACCRFFTSEWRSPNPPTHPRSSKKCDSQTMCTQLSDKLALVICGPKQCAQLFICWHTHTHTHSPPLEKAPTN